MWHFILRLFLYFSPPRHPGYRGQRYGCTTKTNDGGTAACIIWGGEPKNLILWATVQFWHFGEFAIVRSYKCVFKGKKLPPR